MNYTYLTLRQCPELKNTAARWFCEKWSVPEEAYLECMDAYLSGETELGWYLCLCDGQIAGGMGVIENDFHERKDLTPNVCAVYTEAAHRNRGIAGKLLELTVEDTAVVRASAPCISSPTMTASTSATAGSSAVWCSATAARSAGRTFTNKLAMSNEQLAMKRNC